MCMVLPLLQLVFNPVLVKQGVNKYYSGWCLATGTGDA